MTAKEAIKGRCLDCYGWKCADKTCALFGLMRPQEKGSGTDRQGAIRRYCAWCMHGEPVNTCTCVKCAIRQYRASAEGNMHVEYLPF
jgi:hypothetical protein